MTRTLMIIPLFGRMRWSSSRRRGWGTMATTAASDHTSGGGNGSCPSQTRSQGSKQHRFSSSTSSSSSSSSSLVDWKVQEIAGGYPIGILTLQYAPTYNALTVEMGHAFSKLLHEQVLPDIGGGNNNNNQKKKDDTDTDTDGNHSKTTTTTTKKTRDIRAVILTGEGSNAFSAGGDFPWLQALQHNTVHENADAMMSFYQSFLCVRKIPVPVIAALPGPAIGAGAGLALACDFRVGITKPKVLGFNFTKLGIHSGMGSSHFLPQIVPSYTHIHEILLLGQTLSGQEAYDVGLLNRLVPFTTTSSHNKDEPRTRTKEDAKELVMAQAVELALELASQQHPVALRLMVQTLRCQQNVGLEAALQREALAQALCYHRTDWGMGLHNVKCNPEDRQEFDGYFEP